MSVSEEQPKPLTELGVALFFTLWSLVGWWAVAGDPYLWSDYGLDPGPSLMPSIVLTLLSLGSFAMLVRAGMLLRKSAGRRPRENLFSDLATPVLFAASTIAMVPAMLQIGFVPAGAIFAGGWMLLLRDRTREISRWRLVAEVAAATVVGIGLLYLVFVRIIHVPLP